MGSKMQGIRANRKIIICILIIILLVGALVFFTVSHNKKSEYVPPISDEELGEIFNEYKDDFIVVKDYVLKDYQEGGEEDSSYITLGEKGNHIKDSHVQNAWDNLSAAGVEDVSVYHDSKSDKMVINFCFFLGSWCGSYEKRGILWRNSEEEYATSEVMLNVDSWYSYFIGYV